MFADNLSPSQCHGCSSAAALRCVTAQTPPPPPPPHQLQERSQTSAASRAPLIDSDSDQWAHLLPSWNPGREAETTNRWIRGGGTSPTSPTSPSNFGLGLWDEEGGDRAFASLHNDTFSVNVTEKSSEQSGKTTTVCPTKGFEGRDSKSYFPPAVCLYVKILASAISPVVKSVLGSRGFAMFGSVSFFIS